MQPRNERQFLEDILGAIERIQRYAAVGEPDFYSNELVQDGVIRQLGIIGEAAAHLSKTTQAKEPEIPWRKIIAARNWLIHAYADVDLAVVWDTVLGLEGLRVAVERLIEPTKRE